MVVFYACNIHDHRGDNTMAELVWESVNTDSSDTGKGFICDVYRAQVPGGWLVITSSGTTPGIAFYPDPDYDWE